MSSFQALRAYSWERPSTLVVACSDGRLQMAIDEFLSSRNIVDYDRLYLPGGPGALASSGSEYTRAAKIQAELQFLLKAHEIRDLLLVFHGPTVDGPAEATCADYRRLMGSNNPDAIRRQQERDAAELISVFGPKVETCEAIFAEVSPKLRVGFRTLSP